MDPRYAFGTSNEPSIIKPKTLNRARDHPDPTRSGWPSWPKAISSVYLRVRTLSRNVRAGCAEPADEDACVDPVAYEGAADRLPDVAWPWYRLAELLAWAGFAERAEEHLAQAELRSLGNRQSERTNRPLLSNT